jgi:hypothetical protein
MLQAPGDKFFRPEHPTIKGQLVCFSNDPLLFTLIFIESVGNSVGSKFFRHKKRV